MQRVTGFSATTALFCLFVTSAAYAATACVQRPMECGPGQDCADESDPPVAGAAGDLPLIDVGDFQYAGAFVMPLGDYGESSTAYALGTLEKVGNSLFMVGHNHQDAIAEFIIPDLVKSTKIADLNVASAPVQPFSQVLNRPTGGNTQGIDYITGMEMVGDKLIVNAHRFYDGNGDNTHTTVVVSDGGNIAGSTVDGFFELPGAARSGGWISPVPSEWQAAIGTSHITGYASTTAITSRHSVGPSAHALDPDDVLDATLAKPKIPTTKMMEFSLGEPLHADLKNDTLKNDLWTHKSQAVYGFIVPGTRTYATLGSSGGHESGIGYKITRSDGKSCGGYCSNDIEDNYNYYWLWDVSDLLRVKAGKLAASAVRPYSYGKFPAPFQEAGRLNGIGGGTFDEASGTLYLSLPDSDPTQGNYRRAPIIVAYRFPGVR